MKILRFFQIIVLSIGLSGNAFANLNDGLVSYYQFDGDSIDQLGNLSVDGGEITYVAGISGQAGSFDGFDDTIGSM